MVVGTDTAYPRAESEDARTTSLYDGIVRPRGVTPLRLFHVIVELVNFLRACEPAGSSRGISMSSDSGRESNVSRAQIARRACDALPLKLILRAKRFERD